MSSRGPGESLHASREESSDRHSPRAAAHSNPNELTSASGFALHSSDEFALISFSPAEGSTPEMQELAHRIVFLDNRSLHMLGRTGPRVEVRSLLLNTLIFLQESQLEASKSMLRQAYSVYQQHVQSSNRLRYILGVAAGVCSILILASLPHMLGIFVRVAGAELFANLLLVIAFAGLGAITSVLTRLSAIDLSQQTSKIMVFISGASRPITAVCFAIVVFVIIKSGVVELNVGTNRDPYNTALVAAFLCGFSERFAQDILGRIGGEMPPKSPEDAREQ